MEARDVFAYEVILHGPARIELAFAIGIGITDAREVCKERISPHIGDMPFVKRQRHAPIEGRTRN